MLISEISGLKRDDKRLSLSLVGTGQSRGADLVVKGAFPEDYKVFTGNKEDIVNGNVVTEEPNPFSWRYVGPP